MRCNDWCSESREEVIQGFSLPCYPQFTAATWRPQKLELQLNEMLENTKKDKTQNLQPGGGIMSKMFTCYTAECLASRCVGWGVSPSLRLDILTRPTWGNNQSISVENTDVSFKTNFVLRMFKNCEGDLHDMVHYYQRNRKNAEQN